MTTHRYVITIESDSEDTEAIVRETTGYAAECDWDGYRTTPGGRGATTEILAFRATEDADVYPPEHAVISGYPVAPVEDP